jgi:hypothetical protein
MQMYVNLCSGNLYVENQILTLPGVNGQSLNISQNYNSTEYLEGEWALNTDVGLDFGDAADGTVTLDGDSDYEVDFDKKADGSYTSPPGFHASLTLNAQMAPTLFGSTPVVRNGTSMPVAGYCRKPTATATLTPIAMTVTTSRPLRTLRGE